MAKVKHKKWKSVYVEQPKDGEAVVSRIAGEEGYNSGTKWNGREHRFETYTNMGNRFIITVWKHDQWYSR